MNKYKTFTELTDGGPYMTKLLLILPEQVAEGAASPAVFSVFVQRRSHQTGELIGM